MCNLGMRLHVLTHPTLIRGLALGLSEGPLRDRRNEIGRNTSGLRLLGFRAAPMP